MFYENGIGTDKSIHDAYEYYKQAAEYKHKEAWEKVRELEFDD